MTSASTRTAVIRPAAFVAILLGVMAAGPFGAEAAPEFGRAPDAPNALVYVQAMQEPAPGAPGAAPMGRRQGMTREQFVERMRQRLISRGRTPEQASNIANMIFNQADANHDGFLDPAEFQAFRASHPGMGQGRGGGAAARPPAQ